MSFSGTNPKSTFIMGLEYNSVCLNGDVFPISGGGGEKREKIVHRTGGWWKNPFFFLFLSQFSVRNRVDSSF